MTAAAAATASTAVTQTVVTTAVTANSACKHGGDLEPKFGPEVWASTSN